MLLFKPKQVGKGRERVTIKIIVQIFSYPTCYREFQKIAKKEKKNTIMASFQGKTGWQRPRTSENKNFRSEHFLPDRNREFKKYSKKIQKIRKHHYGFFSGKNRLGKAEIK